MNKLKIFIFFVLYIYISSLLAALDQEQIKPDFDHIIIDIEKIYNIVHKEIPLLLPKINYKISEIKKVTEKNIEPEEEKATEKDAEVTLDINAEVDDFIITDEIYDKTFNEVQRLILELNSIIQKRDFIRWKLYLTKQYIDTMSSKKTLDDLSQKEILRKNKIKLEDLKDYFNFVVVPSRSNARLNELIFEQETKVKALMKFEGTSIILYQLEKIDDNWKVSIW